MNRHKPAMSRKKTMQLFVILTIFAWATQTLLHQWGFGQDVNTGDSPASLSAPDAAPLSSTPDMTTGDKFVPNDQPARLGGTLELREDVTILGSTVTLKNISRWSPADAPLFSPLADLKIAQISDKVPFRAITIKDIRQVLHDGGVNLAMINFTGATRCTVTRSDALLDKHQAMDQWIDTQGQGGAADAAPNTPIAPATRPQLVETPIEASVQPEDAPTVHSLSQLLAEDICTRLNIAPEAIQLTFNPQDQKMLGLAEPAFKFDIEAVNVRNLGTVTWDVTIFTVNEQKKATITANARAWEEQVVVAKPLAARQILSAEDFKTQRRLVDILSGQSLLRMDQCVGQQAAYDLKPGQIMTARMVDPVPLVRGGQLITITLTQGSVQIRSVARALEPGVLGQTIKARNDTSREVFDVTVTGTQEGRLDAAQTN